MINVAPKVIDVDVDVELATTVTPHTYIVKVSLARVVLLATLGLAAFVGFSLSVGCSGPHCSRSQDPRRLTTDTLTNEANMQHQSRCRRFRASGPNWMLARLHLPEGDTNMDLCHAKCELKAKQVGDGCCQFIGEIDKAKYPREEKHKRDVNYRLSKPCFEEGTCDKEQACWFIVGNAGRMVTGLTNHYSYASPITHVELTSPPPSPETHRHQNGDDNSICEQLFAKKNARQEDKWCLQVDDPATCGNYYISTSTGTFRSCFWDESQDKCTANQEEVRCTPKRGQALSKKQSSDHCADMQLLGPNHWFYNWGRMPSGTYGDCAGMYDSGFVPQIWGRWGIPTKEVWPMSDAILGFNEPDNHEEANMTATEAADLWPQIMQKAADLSIPRIGSPATQTADPSKGNNEQTEWYDDFFQSCGATWSGTSWSTPSKCKVDFLVVHTYKTNTFDAKAALTSLHERYQLPLWVKEFNKGGRWSGLNIDKHLEYMREMVKWMENQAFIERYAWMSARNNLYEPTTLISATTNELTALGKLYKELPMNVGK